MCSMPDQSTPEIETLRMVAERPDEDSITQFEPFVTLDRAIQAVRDTETRVRREVIAEYSDAVESRFLSPDNPEGNA